LFDVKSKLNDQSSQKLDETCSYKMKQKQGR
jgi:hypothetical protein